MRRIIPVTLSLALGLSIAACGSSRAPEPTAPPVQSPTPKPSSTPTPTPTSTPAPTPTAIGGGTGQVLYSRTVQERAPLGDGTFLIYTGYALNRLDLDTLESEELISKEQLEQELGKGLYRTVFSPSPDGTMVLITASTSVSFEDLDTFEYYIASLDLTSLVPILDPGATAINWTWSPDGSRLLGDALMSNSKTIFVVNSDGSGLTELTKFPAIASPAWSADGSKVFWAALGVPMVMEADGTNQQPVGDVDQVVARMSFSPDGGKVAYLTDQSSLYIAQSDFSEGQLGSGRFDSETCQGRFPPGISGWSVDGEYLIVRNYYCVVINRQLFPKAGDILVRTSDGERVNEGRFAESEPCGWSPDDKLVYIHKTDEGVRLVLVDVEAIDTGTAVEIVYSGTCPSWIP